MGGLIKKRWLVCLGASGIFGLMPAGDANAQMSHTNCMVMSGGLVSCNTIGGGDSSSSSSYDGGRGLGEAIANIRENSFRKKVGRMLADGDCQAAARYAYERGRLELGASIADGCRQPPPPAQPLAASRPNPVRIAPGQIESALIHVAQNAKTPMEIFDETTVSKVEAVGNQLILIALVDRKGATITGDGRLKIVREVCAESSPILEAGAIVRIDFYERGKRTAFDSVVTTHRECGFGI
jgi:hypothetical protein